MRTPAKEPRYPHMARDVGIEVGHCRNGRPGYRWAPGWVIHFSPCSRSTPMRYQEAREYLAALRACL